MKLGILQWNLLRGDLHIAVSLGELPKIAAHTNNTLDWPVFAHLLRRPNNFGPWETTIDRFHCIYIGLCQLQDNPIVTFPFNILALFTLLCALPPLLTLISRSKLIDLHHGVLTLTAVVKLNHTLQGIWARNSHTLLTVCLLQHISTA